MREYIKTCLRIAWRHSWERSQSVTAIVWVGINAAAWKWPWLVSYVSGGKITEVNDWALAAILFGGIVVLRLLLSPYWAWKEMRAERDAKDLEKEAKLSHVEKERAGLQARLRNESDARIEKLVDQACAILRASPNQPSFTLRALQLAGVAELETEEEFTFICQALVNRNYPDPRDLIESVLPDGWLNFIRFANKDGRALDRPESVYENGMRMYGTFVPPSCSDAEFGALVDIALSPLNPTPPSQAPDKEAPLPLPASSECPEK